MSKSTAENPIVVPEVEKQLPTELTKVSGKPKSWTEVVNGNSNYGNAITLEFIQNEDVQITEDEWAEGAQIWKFPVIFQVISIKPLYMEMFRWVNLNWGKLNPKVS